jgi:hypothetical protein
LAGDYSEEDRDHRDDEKQVDEPTTDMEREETEDPHQDKHDRKRPNQVLHYFTLQ